MLIYVCSSSHGFGHAARDAAVLQELHQLRPDWRLVFSSKLPPAVLRLLIGIPSVEIRSLQWDVGMVQADALGSDPEGTLKALERLEQVLPDQLRDEARWIRAQGEEVLILADIPPSAADLSAQLDCPLVWLGNFGWDAIYAPFGGRLREHAERAEQAYRRGNFLLRCPFDLAMDWGLPELPLGLVTSRARDLPPHFLKELHCIEHPLVMVGFGGLGLSIDPQHFGRWPDQHFLMPSPLKQSTQRVLQGVSNLTLLPDGLRPLDLMPLCSRHLGKPGFSTFCEVMAAGVGMHVVERFDFAEVSALMQGLKNHANHLILSRSAYLQGDWGLDRPLQMAQQGGLRADGAGQAAAAIVTLAERI